MPFSQQRASPADPTRLCRSRAPWARATGAALDSGNLPGENRPTTRAPFQVFLLGTPGCGKSEIYRRLGERVVSEGLAQDVVRIDDYPKVRACFEEDDAAERTGRPRIYSSRGEDGGWLITNRRSGTTSSGA